MMELFVTKGAPLCGAGWTSMVKPLQVGSGYTARDLCDGQTLDKDLQTRCSRLPICTLFSRRIGSLCSLLLSPVERCLAVRSIAKMYCREDLLELNYKVRDRLADRGIHWRREQDDRGDVPNDNISLDLLLSGDFFGRLRVGRQCGSRSLAAEAAGAYPKKERGDPIGYLQKTGDGDSFVASKLFSGFELYDNVLEVHPPS